MLLDCHSIDMISPINSVHNVAAKGFHSAAEAYERGRPEYSRSSVDFLMKTLNITPEKIVVDLAAGTGKFTRLLVSGGAKLIAIEPVEGMRYMFSSLLPEVEILDGTAESIPLPSASIDVVVVAQAFQWFHGKHSLQEIYRILKPYGQIGLIWNVRDDSVEWVSKMTEIIESYRHFYHGNTPQYKSGEWKQSFDETILFTLLQTRTFKQVHKYNRQTLVDRVASISWIAVLPEAIQSKILHEIRDLLDKHPILIGKEEFYHPYRTDIFWCAKKQS
jgi:ubiquinone/menaquinone biosynthesis C-methylase UbiE